MVLSEVPELPTLAMVENFWVLEPIDVVMVVSSVDAIPVVVISVVTLEEVSPFVTVVSSVPSVDAVPVVVIRVVTLEEVSPSNNT